VNERGETFVQSFKTVVAALLFMGGIVAVFIAFTPTRLGNEGERGRGEPSFGMEL